MDVAYMLTKDWRCQVVKREYKYGPAAYNEENEIDRPNQSDWNQKRKEVK